MKRKCPYCKSEKIQPVVIRLSNNQEQKVMLCNKCHKIFNTNKEN